MVQACDSLPTDSLPYALSRPITLPIVLHRENSRASPAQVLSRPQYSLILSERLLSISLPSPVFRESDILISMATRSTKGNKREKAEAGILHCGIHAPASNADISQVDWSLLNGVSGVSGNGATSIKAGTATERIQTAAPNINTWKLAMLPLPRLSRSAPKNPDTHTKGVRWMINLSLLPQTASHIARH